MADKNVRQPLSEQVARDLERDRKILDTLADRIEQQKYCINSYYNRIERMQSDFREANELCKKLEARYARIFIQYEKNKILYLDLTQPTRKPVDGVSSDLQP